MKKINLNLGKIHLIVIGAIVAVIAGVAGYYGLWDKYHMTKPVAPLKVCNDEIVKKAGTALKNNDAQVLITLQPEILKLKDYQRDQSCLYVLIQSAMAQEDTKATSIYLGQLKRVYGEGGYSKAFPLTVMSYNELVKLSTSLKQGIEQEEKEETQRIKDESESLNKVDDINESRQR